MTAHISRWKLVQLGNNEAIIEPSKKEKKRQPSRFFQIRAP
jgi:hypothetical protein